MSKILQKKQSIFAFLFLISSFFYIKPVDWSGFYNTVGGVIAHSPDTLALASDAIFDTGLTVVGGPVVAGPNALIIRSYLDLADSSTVLSFTATSTGLTLDGNVSFSHGGSIAMTGDQSLVIAHGTLSFESGAYLKVDSGTLVLDGLFGSANNLGIIDFSTNGYIDVNSLSVSFSGIVLQNYRDDSFQNANSRIYGSNSYLMNATLAADNTLPLGVDYIEGDFDLGGFTFTTIQDVILSDTITLQSSGALNCSYKAIDFNFKKINCNGYALTINNANLTNFRSDAIDTSVGGSSITFVNCTINNLFLFGNYTLPTIAQGITDLTGTIDFHTHVLDFASQTRTLTNVTLKNFLTGATPTSITNYTNITFSTCGIENLTLSASHTLLAGITKISGNLRYNNSAYVLTVNSSVGLTLTDDLNVLSSGQLNFSGTDKTLHLNNNNLNLGGNLTLNTNNLTIDSGAIDFGVYNINRNTKTLTLSNCYLINYTASSAPGAVLINCTFASPPLHYNENFYLQLSDSSNKLTGKTIQQYLYKDRITLSNSEIGMQKFHLEKSGDSTSTGTVSASDYFRIVKSNVTPKVYLKAMVDTAYAYLDYPLFYDTNPNFYDGGVKWGDTPCSFIKSGSSVYFNKDSFTIMMNMDAVKPYVWWVPTLWFWNGKLYLSHFNSDYVYAPLNYAINQQFKMIGREYNNTYGSWGSPGQPLTINKFDQFATNSDATFLGGFNLTNTYTNIAGPNSLNLYESLNLGNNSSVLSLNFNSGKYLYLHSLLLNSGGFLKFTKNQSIIVDGTFNMQNKNLKLSTDSTSTLSFIGNSGVSDILDFRGGYINLNNSFTGNVRNLNFQDLTISFSGLDSFLNAGNATISFQGCGALNLTLKNNYTLDDGFLYISGILDLAGYTLTRDSNLILSDNLSIKSGSVNFFGKTLDLNNKTLTLLGNVNITSNMTIKTGIIDFNGYGFNIASGVTVTFTDIDMLNLDLNSIVGSGSTFGTGIVRVIDLSISGNYTLPYCVNRLYGILDLNNYSLTFSNLVVLDSDIDLLDSGTIDLDGNALDFNNHIMFDSGLNLIFKDGSLVNYIPDKTLSDGLRVTFLNTIMAPIYLFGSLGFDMKLSQDLLMTGTMTSNLVPLTMLDLNNYNLIFSSNYTLTGDISVENTAKIFFNSSFDLDNNRFDVKTTSTIEANGNLIDLGMFGRFNIYPNQTLTIKNATIKNLKTGSLLFGNASSGLYFDNVSVYLSDDLILNSGFLAITGYAGFNTIYDNNITLSGANIYVNNMGDLEFLSDTIFKYSSGNIKNNGQIFFDNSTIDITDSGFLINSGKTNFKRTVIIKGPNTLDFRGSTFKSFAGSNYNLQNGASFRY